MQIKRLEIRRKESYEDGVCFKGLLQTVSLEGEQSVSLSTGTIAKIFSLIRSDVVEQAHRNAQATGAAFDEASSEIALIAFDGDKS